MSSEIHELIIIGAGPAGLTAAIYAARAELSPLMIEGYQSGGQLMLTSEVENFPGFSKGINGPDLIKETRDQALRFGTEILSEDVTKADFSQRPFKIEVGKKVFYANSIIISTGASARWLNLESEQALIGRGVSSCATCDGAFFKEKEVVVVGGGDSAMEEANFLTKFASKVTLINRSENFRASKIMLAKVRANPKIEIITNAVIEKVLGVEEKKVSGVEIKDVKTGDLTDIKCSGLFIAIGHVPNVSLFDGQIEVDENKYIITKPKSTATNIKGVFACGDVQDSIFRQAITAAGTGCMSAMEAERYLTHK